MSQPAVWETSWTRALDELELDVAWVEEVLRLQHLPSGTEVSRLAAWTPPNDLGPLPVSLSLRAATLLDRQTAAARRTVEAITRSRRHLAALDALQPRRPEVSVYVDLEA